MMKKICLIATGGTIASRNDGEGLAPMITPEEILDCVPEIASRCQVSAIRPFYLDSTNLYSRHWLELAAIIKENYDEFDGFVLLHGTDTMAYTAAALSYLIQGSAKPIVLTGSQKSIYLRDTDARSNLCDAFAYCTDEGASGVHIVFDGKIILGTRAKKTRTKSYNAFSSIDFPEVGIIRDGKAVYYIPEEKPLWGPVFFDKMADEVFVLKMIPGIKPDIFDYLSEHYGAVIIESFGSGGLPRYEDDAFFEGVKRFTDKGKFVVIGTQVEREGSALDVYEVGKRFLSCKNILEERSMTLEATVTKLMWVLAQTKEEAEVRKLFLTPVGKDII